ncbi:MAG: hypothetical protein WAK96_03025 [Desulfobaccales bacterium]
MASANIKREIMAVLMESPLYFTIPLRKRLEFLKLFSQQSVPHRICEYKELWIGGKSDFEGAAFDKNMNINDPKDPHTGSLTQDHPEFLSVKMFAEILGVHWFTVWRWTVEKRIRFRQIKVGGKILIPISELSRLQGRSE